MHQSKSRQAELSDRGHPNRIVTLSRHVTMALGLTMKCACYSVPVMRACRTTLAVMAVLMWALSAPLAMASDGCMAMGAMCEGPCGASSCITTSAAPVIQIALATISTLSPHVPEDVSAALLALPDPPPRPALHSA